MRTVQAVALMCRDAELLVEPTLRGAADARRFVRDRCLSWNLDDICYELTLLVSELVTNALLHARTAMTLRVSVVHGIAEVAVTDGDDRLPVVRPHRTDLVSDLDALEAIADRPDAIDVDPRHQGLHAGDAGAVTAGRGLLIVDAVADEWGTASLSRGKAVWFTLQTPPEWIWDRDCACEQAPAGQTASGRPVTHIAGPWDG